MGKYCSECGTELVYKELKGEGMVPYCPFCEEYRFPTFNVAISMIVIDEKTERILLIQQYGRPHYILVAGYVNKKESVEHAAIRELKEETDLDVYKMEFNQTEYYEPSNTLMCNFTVYVKDGSCIHVNEEIDSYAWFTKEKALNNIKKNSLASKFLYTYLTK